MNVVWIWQIPDKLPSSIEFTNEDNTVKYVDTIIKKDAKEDAEDSMDESAPPLWGEALSDAEFRGLD